MRSDEQADDPLRIFDTVLVFERISECHPLLKLNGPKLLVYFNYLISRELVDCFFSFSKCELELLVKYLQ